MNNILVLMSTYNGEKYIREQLDCILNQEGVFVNLLIRDDGSTDKTLNILKEYSEIHENINVYYGNNKGFTFSFYDLLSTANGYKYYALADQDDIWEKNKLSTAILKMGQTHIMYASNMKIVDQDLNFINTLYKDFEYENQLLKCFFSFYNPFGCTLVWKNELQEKVKSNLPKIRIPHDLWMHVSANFNGSVYIDENSYILHRIHGENACGIGKSTLIRLKKLKKFYLSDFRTTTDDTLEEAIRAYKFGKLNKNQIEFINIILNYKKSFGGKLSLLKCKELKKIKYKKRMEFIFLILLNKF
ncbi:MAG: glycosyltransferase [Bacilli bacterium]